MGQIIKRPSFADAEKAGITPPLWLNPVLRDRHIKGTTEHNEFTKRRGVSPSYFNDGLNLQALIYLYAGTGKPIGNRLVGLPGSREVIELKREIGYYVNKHNQTPLPTRKFMIVYSGDDAHVIPASPNK